MLTEKSNKLPKDLTWSHDPAELPERIQALETQVQELKEEIKTLRAWYNALSNELNRIAPSSRNPRNGGMP